ncbi:8-oxo-dGTP diphosphatase [Aerococcaceae bacterium DSM 111020]|nr:8-oxo-dGTP diphosphatase [Aerococcaceae bacterium DSM 111020]
MLSTICYIDNGSQLLLLKRDKKLNDIHEGKYVSVGGKFEPGETPEACAIREIKEETGLNARSLDLRGFITFPDFRHDGEDWYSFVYIVTDYDGELVEECDEGTLEWVDYDDVLSKPTWDGDYIYLQWLKDNRPFFSASFTYDLDEQLIDHSVVFYDKEGVE